MSLKYVPTIQFYLSLFSYNSFSNKEASESHISLLDVKKKSFVCFHMFCVYPFNIIQFIGYLSMFRLFCRHPSYCIQSSYKLQTHSLTSRWGTYMLLACWTIGRDTNNLTKYRNVFKYKSAVNFKQMDNWRGWYQYKIFGC